MPYASESFTGSLAVQTYTFGAGTGSLTGGLKFLSSAHLTVLVNNSATSFTVPTGHATFTITGLTVQAGDAITVRRTTPATESGRLVDFSDLSHVRQSDLDRSSLQLLYLAQEALDVAAGVERLELGVDSQWDAENRRIENVANGTAATDGVNKSQLDAASVSAGNLPVVSSADNDKSLWVVAGAWAIRTPSQARTHLGLGTAALLNVGVGANQVVQFDGSARYPSNDGRNIDLSANATLNLRYRTTIGNILQSSEATPVNDATATWSQSAASRLTPGTLTDLDNSSDIVVDNGAKKITLSAGTWEVEYMIRAYNVNAAAGNDQDLRVKVTNDDDTGAQVVYDTDHDRVSVESPGAATRALIGIHQVLIIKLAAGGAIVLRAANEDGVDIRINTTRIVCRKVSTST